MPFSFDLILIMTVGDLLISACTLKDLETWEVAAQSILKYINSRGYVVLVPQRYLDNFIKCTPRQIVVLSEEDIIPSSFISVIDQYLDQSSGQAKRAGWIYQQFLKIQAVLASQNDRIILWDSDTVPLRKISFFDETARPRYFTSHEYHAPYFALMSTIFGYGKTCDHSFIAQSFPLRRQWVVDMCREIEVKTGVSDWKLGILNYISPVLGESPFSEYETIGSYALRRLEKADQPLPQVNSEKWVRNGYEIIGPARNLSFFMHPALSDAAYVSFERWSKPFAFYSNPLIAKVSPGFKARLSLRSKQFLSLGWHTVTLNTSSMNRRINDLMTPISVLLHEHESEEDKIHRFLSDLFLSAPMSSILQIGANDGVQNDPLRPFLPRHKGPIVLVEALPYYCDILRKLYSSQDNVQVVNTLVASNEADRTLFYINPALADEMDGDGPMNKWAHGQGSFCRDTIVSWIQKNQFRGSQYRANMPLYINSIESSILHSTTLALLVEECQLHSIELLVIDVQGAEMEVLSSLHDIENLPRFILYEDDSSLPAEESKSLNRLLTKCGYVFIAGTDNRLWGLDSLGLSNSSLHPD